MDPSNETQQVRDLQKVLDITRAMVATEDLDELLGLIVERGMELLAAERATVFLYDPPTDELVSRVAAQADEIRIPAGSGIAGAAARSGKVVNVPDAYADDRFNPAIDRETGFRTRNILSIPMHGYDGSLVGVLQVLNKRSGEFGDYEISLAETLAAQAGVAIQRANLIREYLRKQEMERAMKIAQDIQLALLPETAPQIPGFDVAGFTRPADQTGGDTYDYMPVADGGWMFVVADATGHGIGPALVITTTRAILRAISLQGADVTEILKTANELLSADLQDGRFVTCFFGLLAPERSRLTYASAGHGPMLFYKCGSDKFEAVAATSLPLGIVEETDYSETVEHDFVSGDFAVILTDGFSEAANSQREEFGVQRIAELLREHRNLPAAEMIEKLCTAVDAFTTGQPQADDLTAVIIKKL
jgi:phosphoserine phosphatase